MNEKEKIKVIFLEDEGVLKPAAIAVVFNDAANMNYVYNLQSIIDDTDAKIVLTSSKRICYEKRYESINAGELIPVVDSTDITSLYFALKELNIEIYDKTNILGVGISKEEEIEDYLNTHDNIESYVIIDNSIN